MRQTVLQNLSPHPWPHRPEAEATFVSIDKLCRWIEEHHQEPIGWQELIEASGLPQRDLVRLFQIHKKTTPMAYIRQSRLRTHA